MVAMLQVRGHSLGVGLKFVDRVRGTRHLSGEIGVCFLQALRKGVTLHRTHLSRTNRLCNRIQFIPNTHRLLSAKFSKTLSIGAVMISVLC